ncbi:MAG: hypothetical protein WBG11_10625 [Methylocella sp.]
MAKKYEPGLENTIIADRDIAEEYRNITTFKREWHQIFSDRYAVSSSTAERV